MSDIEGPPFPESSDAALADSLLRTKLVPPQAPLAEIPRRALLDRLDRARGGGLTLVVAAAGYGKTTLLAQWRHRLAGADVIVGWLTLDENDSDPLQFLSGITLSLARAGASLGPLENAAQKGFADVQPRAALAALLAAIGRQAQSVVLMLDDYHRVQSPAIDRLVDFLVSHRAPALHVVLSSRTRPDIAIASLRAQGQAHEIGAAALRFSVSEARGLFPPELADTDLSRLTDRTEGWAVALQLARLWLGEGAAHGDLLERFSGRTAEVAEYLAEQVLGGLDESTRRFLLETAPLEQFNWEMANAVCHRDDAAVVIEQLSRVTSLLVPLDSERHWYRYHHLFADFLVDLLRRSSPPRYADICSTASRWYEHRGALVEAVRYARAAGDLDRAARLIERAGGWEMVLLGGIGRMRTLLNFVPPERMSEYPRLQVARAYLAVKDGHVAAAASVLAEVRARRAGPADPELDRDLELMGALIAVYEDRIEAWPPLAQLDEAIRAALPRDAMAAAVLCSVRAVIAIGFGNVAEVERSAIEAIRHMRAVGSALGRNYCLFHLGLAQQLGGRLREAEATLSEALTAAEENFGADSGMKAVADVMLGQALYARGDLAGAARHLQVSLAHVDAHDGWLDVYAAGYETLARLAEARGDAAGVEAALARGHGTAAARNLPRLAATLRAIRGCLLAQRGEPLVPTVATALAEVLEGPDRVARWREEQPARIALALDRLRTGDVAGARALLVPLLERGAADGRHAHVLEARIVEVIADEAEGATDAAVGRLLALLPASIAEGQRRVYLDFGSRLGPTLQRALRAARDAALGSLTTQFIADLLEELRREGARIAGAGADMLLSRREHEVLVELARGLSNKEIARSLDLTENTVKFHLKSIYEKLDVDRRSRAIAVAQERRLIAPAHPNG